MMAHCISIHCGAPEASCSQVERVCSRCRNFRYTCVQLKAYWMKCTSVVSQVASQKLCLRTLKILHALRNSDCTQVSCAQLLEMWLKIYMCMSFVTLWETRPSLIITIRVWEREILLLARAFPKMKSKLSVVKTTSLLHRKYIKGMLCRILFLVFFCIYNQKCLLLGSQTHPHPQDDKAHAPT